MDWGMSNRMSRIFNPKDGRAVMLAVDHGYFLGAISRLEEPNKTITPLIPYVDSLMLTRGVLRNCVGAQNNISVVLRVSGGNSVLKEDLSNEEVTVSMEEALRLNVSAVALSIYLGSENEHQTLMALANLVNAAENYGMPVLAVTAVGKELEKRDAKFLSTASRIAAEMGARIVKTYYCEDFEKVVNSCPVPIVIAGGPKMKSEYDVLDITYQALSRGAKGVDMGRNIWQSRWPIAMVSAVRAIVHEGLNTDSAFALFNKLKDES